MDPVLDDLLRRKAGLDVPSLRDPLADRAPDSPTPMTVAQADAPPAPAPSAPPSPPTPAPQSPPDFRSMLYQNLGQMARQLGPDFDPEASRKAMEEDRANSAAMTLGNLLRRSAALIRNEPVSASVDPSISNLAYQRVQQRRGDVLGTADAAAKLQGMLMQQSLMDPNSPMSRARQDQILRLDPAFVAKRYGGEQGVRSVPGFLIDQDMAAREKLAETQGKEATTVKTGKEAENIGANTTKTGVETTKILAEMPGILADAMLKRRSVEKVDPRFIADAQKNLGIQITADMTYGEADKRIDEALKARGQDVELMKWRAEHSPAIAPGVLYTGPGVPNPDEAKDYREKLAATNKLNGLLTDYRNLVEQTGRFDKLAGPDAAKLRTLHGQLMAEVRTLIGARTLTDSDIKLADAIVPPAAGTEGVLKWTPSTLAAIDTLRKNARTGIGKVGDSRFYHVYDPNQAFGPDTTDDADSAPPPAAAPPSLRRKP